MSAIASKVVSTMKRRTAVTTYTSTTVMEILIGQQQREIERNAERRRMIGELVHAPHPVRRNLARLRSYLFLDAIPEVE
jgi:hypothetical protein